MHSFRDKNDFEKLWILKIAHRTAPHRSSFWKIAHRTAPHRKLFQKLRTAPHRSQNLLHRTAPHRSSHRTANIPELNYYFIVRYFVQDIDNSSRQNDGLSNQNLEIE